MLKPRRFIGLTMAAIATALIALLLNSSEVSPSLPAAQAVIQPDTSGDPCPVPAQGKLRSDAECDLTIRLTNNSAGARTFSISASGAANALDESVFSPALPGNPAQTKLGECPCSVTVPSNTSEEYGLRVKVNDISPGWYTSTLKVHQLHTGARLLHSFQLKIEEVNPQWDVQLSTDTLTIDEADDPKTSSTSEHQATYSVSLTTAPTSDVIVSPVSSDTDVVTVSPSLTFTSVNWQTAQTVTVTAVNDDIDSASDRYTSIRHTVSGTGSQDVMVDDVAITVADDDTRGVSISATSLSVDEVDDPGTSGVQEHQATYEVTLTSEPVGGDVTIAAASGDPSVATAAPATLTFTSSDWSTPQTVTVSAVDDGTNTVAGRQTTIAHTVASTGDYSGVAADTLGVAVGTNRIDPCVADTYGDYDIDNDGLIEICNLAQLNAIRWDLNGDGVADVYPPDQHGHTGHDPDGATKIAAAFPNAATGMGCPTGGCKGYELSADLDFDTNGNGQADSGDDYWNGGDGWYPLWGGKKIYSHSDDRRMSDPVGTKSDGQRPNPRARMFTAVFEGNGRTIANFYINDPDLWNVGLFSIVGPGGKVRNFGLTAPNEDSGVVGAWAVGAVAGLVEGGRVSGVYSELNVTGTFRVGGLIGGIWRHALVIESYATGNVTAASEGGGLVGLLNYAGVAAVYATGDVTVSIDEGGGLAGYRADGHLRAAYATGAVTYTGTSNDGNRRIGGLVGGYGHAYTASWMRANYATGLVTMPNGRVTAGGLTGGCRFMGSRTRSEGGNYWNVETSGMTTSPDCGVGLTTAELQAPTGYTGIYKHWNVDVNVGGFYGSFLGAGDDPWDFGTSTLYPVLKYCADKPGIETGDGQPYCPLQPDQQRKAWATASADTAVQPLVSVTGPASIDEGQNIEFTFVTNPNPPANISVSINIATIGDYGVTAETKTITIPIHGSYTLSISTTNDQVNETDGTVTVTIESGTDYSVSTTAGSATVTVQDNDGTVQTCDLPSDQVRVSEVEGWRDEYSHEAHVERWNRVLAALGEDTGESAMTADEARDIKSRIDNSRWDRTVRTLDAMEQCADSTNTTEPPSTPEVSISGGSGITEGGDATFAVTADPAPSADLDVTVTVSQTGDFGASTGAQTVTISTSGSATLTVGTSDDSVDEADGSITVTVSTGTGYTVSTTAGSASVAVADNDDPAPPSCDASTAIGWAKKAYDWHVAQGDQAALFWRILNTLGADNMPTKPSDVTDETVTASYVKTYSDGRGWSGWTSTNEALKDCEASTTTDEVVPPPPPPPPATPEVSISAGAGITEGGSATFTLTANPAPQAPLSVSVSVTQSGDFGVSTGSRTVTIPTTGSATLTVATSDDSVDEANGSVTATVNGGTGYTVSGTAGSASVSVADDDAAPQATPEISITAGAGVSEGGNASFTLTANPAPTSPLAVTVNVSQSGDYGVATGSQTVTIATSGSYTLTIATSDDSTDESDGSVTVTVNTGTGYDVSSSYGTATVAISDDDPPAPKPVYTTPTLTISDASGTEGDTITFTVTLSPYRNGYVWVNYYSTPLYGERVSAGSGDFEGVYGMLTFKPGETEKTITVALTDDSKSEGTEAFGLRLYSEAQAQVAVREGIGTIIDND